LKLRAISFESFDQARNAQARAEFSGLALANIGRHWPRLCKFHYNGAKNPRDFLMSDRYIDNGNFVMSATAALSPAMTSDLNFFQNVEKWVSPKALGDNNRIKTPASQVCPRVI
jgi:hypothetical protein